MLQIDNPVLPVIVGEKIYFLLKKAYGKPTIRSGIVIGLDKYGRAIVKCMDAGYGYVGETFTVNLKREWWRCSK